MDKWYHPKGKLIGKGKLGEWSKDKSTVARRRAAISAKKGDSLKAARALGSLANVTKDAKTARLAKADSKYFYKRHKETKR